MKFRKTIIAALIGLSAVCGIAGTATARPAQRLNSNERLVLRAMTELFVKRNTAVLQDLWVEDYKQHNPTIADGREHLKGLIDALPANFIYEPGFIASHGDIVMIRGRYTGTGPKPYIIVDIFRVRNGRLAEHWDVAQEEVPAAETKSGNPMFDPNEGR